MVRYFVTTQRLYLIEMQQSLLWILQLKFTVQKKFSKTDLKWLIKWLISRIDQ